MFKLSVISPNATYQLNTSVNPVDEGTSSTVTLTTTGVQLGQAIPYTISGVGITTADISGDALSGNFVVDSTGHASKTLNIAADLTTEGAETLTMSLGNGTNVSLAINDTSLTPSAGDVYWDNVVLAMHMDGTNGSTTFVDAKGHTSTSNVSVISTTQSKFGGASMYNTNGGGSNHILMTASADYNLTDFTVDFWCYRTSSAPGMVCTSGVLESTLRWGISFDSSGRCVFNRGSGSWWWSTAVTYSVVPALNTWHHLAYVVSGVNVTLYVNGVSYGTQAMDGTITAGTTNNIAIGGYLGAVNGATDFTGYLDDFRITKGVARYTSNFTVPSAAFPNMRNENVDPWWNNVVLAMHMDGANGGSTFVDAKGGTITNNGVVTNTSTVKYGTASAYFGGSAKYMSLPHSDVYNFGSGNFTVEFWMYCGTAWASQPSSCGILGQKANDSSTGWVIYRDGYTPTKINARISGTTNCATNSTPSTGVWQHWALVRTGSILSWYKDGVLDSTGTTSATVSDTTGLMYVGYAQTWSGYLRDVYLDDIRVTKGIARYVQNFTPPSRSFAETA